MKNLRKVLVFVLFAFATVFAFGMKNVKAAEVIAAEADFTTISAKNSNYTNKWTYGDWTVSGGANNNGGWNYIKLGGKSSNLSTLSDIYVATKSAVASEVTRATVHIAANSLSKSGMSVTSWGLHVYSDSAMTNEIDYVAGETITKSAATFTFVPTNGTAWAANSYYKVKFVVANTSTSNGIVCLDNISLYKEAAAGLQELAAPTVSVAGKVASWEAIEGAVKYNVGLYSEMNAAATYEVETTETSYDFSKFVSAGTWYVKAQAVADDVTALSSDYSSNEATLVNTESTIECTPTEFLSFIDPGQVNTYVVSGTLKAFYTNYNESTTNNYDSGYNNASFYLTDGTSKIIVFRIIGNQGANLKVGDVLTVKGKLQAYNGVNQIPQGGSYVKITPAAAVQFETLETKTSLKLTIENEAVSAVAIRFGMMMTVAQYEALVAADATFGVAVVKKATLGENDLAEVADQYAFACASVVRVNANGEADEAGEYYQFAFVVNNVPSTDYAVELVAACYVLVNGEYFVAAETVQSVQSVAQAYVNAEDTSAYANYLAYLNELAGN